ncbi:MAG: hypothetical protein H6R05_411 [Burkholderiaceae bacterium]|nr:hypothetical protein [Burkholderiaceae bacterium]
MQGLLFYGHHHSDFYICSHVRLLKISRNLQLYFPLQYPHEFKLLINRP